MHNLAISTIEKTLVSGYLNNIAEHYNVDFEETVNIKPLEEIAHLSHFTQPQQQYQMMMQSSPYAQPPAANIAPTHIPSESFSPQQPQTLNYVEHCSKKMSVHPSAPTLSPAQSSISNDVAEKEQMLGNTEPNFDELTARFLKLKQRK